MQIKLFHPLVRMVEWDWLPTVLLVGGLLMAVGFSMDEISDSDAMQVRIGMTEEIRRWLTRKQKKRKNNKSKIMERWRTKVHRAVQARPFIIHTLSIITPDDHPLLSLISYTYQSSDPLESRNRQDPKLSNGSRSPSFHTKSRAILTRGSMETDKEVLDGTTDLGPVTLTPNIAIIFLYEKEQGPLPGTGVIDWSVGIYCTLVGHSIGGWSIDESHHVSCVVCVLYLSMYLATCLSAFYPV